MSNLNNSDNTNEPIKYIENLINNINIEKSKIKNNMNKLNNTIVELNDNTDFFINKIDNLEKL